MKYGKKYIFHITCHSERSEESSEALLLDPSASPQDDVYCVAVPHKKYSYEKQLGIRVQFSKENLSRE